jgi:hypothetical protein
MKTTINHWLQSKRSLPIRYVWLVLPLAISFIALNFTPLKEGDLWWHIQIGQQIFADGKIPPFDLFTFTAYGQPYTFSHSWFSDVLFYGAEKIGGLGALVLMQALVSLATTLIILRQSLLRGATPALAASLTLLGWIGLYPFSSTRPQIFSFLLMAALYAVLSGYFHHQKNHLWLMPVLMVLWVNLHGGWPIGLMLIGLEIGCAVLLKLWGQPTVALKPAIAWGAATGAATLLNPKGIMLYGHVLTVNTNPVIQQFISEWQPLVITNVIAWAFFGLLVLWIIGMAYQQRSVPLRDLSVMLLLAAMSLRYLRMEPYFFAVAVPITTATLAGINWQALFNRFGPLLAADENKAAPLAGYFNGLMVILFGAAAIFSLPGVRLGLMQQTETSLISPHFPIASVQTLKEQMPPAANVFNLAEWGGYLIWQLHPAGRVFADGRAELLTPQMWDDYITLSTGGQAWAALLDQYQIDYLVLDKSRQAGLILNASQQGWHCLSEDTVAIILSRQPATGSCPSLKDNQP